MIGLKKTCLGVLDRGDCDKNNETDLKEGGGTEMSTTVLPIRDARSLSLCITYLLLYKTSTTSVGRWDNVNVISVVMAMVRNISRKRSGVGGATSIPLI